jgi:hypothetical protein
MGRRADADWSLIRFVELAAHGIPLCRQEILVPVPAYNCQFCGAAVDVRAVVDLSNGGSIRGRPNHFQQRCAAMCEHGQEWTAVHAV